MGFWWEPGSYKVFPGLPAKESKWGLFSVLLTQSAYIRGRDSQCAYIGSRDSQCAYIGGRDSHTPNISENIPLHTPEM